MEKQEIKKVFFDKGILNSKGLKKFCWEKYFDEEAQNIFNEFKKSYRTADEAWFCLCRDVEPYHCEVCGNLAKFTGSYRSLILGYNTTCEKCSTNQTARHLNSFQKTIAKRTGEERKQIMDKRRQTNKEKYGDENYNLYGSKSFKQNLLEKYGDEHYSNHEQARKTLIERYGVDHNFKLINSSEHAKYIWDKNHDKILNSVKQTNLNRYGVEFPGQSPEIINKMVLTKKLNVNEIEKQYNCVQQQKLFKLYGEGWLSLGLDKIVIGGRKFISNENVELIKKYFSEGPHNNLGISNKEKALLEYIKSIYFDKILENSKNIAVNNNRRCYYELDIYLPKLHIAFEFNGMYWHSNIFKDLYYHQRKTKLAYEQGIQLINIYEYDWDNNKEQIKENIKKLLSGENCSTYNWVPLNEYANYTLSEPLCIFENEQYKVYNEGKFIKI